MPIFYNTLTTVGCSILTSSSIDNNF